MKHAHDSWTPEEAAKTQAILAKAEAKKSPFVRTIDALLYWVLLLLAILANFVLSVVLAPALLVITGPFLYFLLFIAGATFGWLFGFILHSLERLQPTQHVIAGIAVPVLAFLNVVIIATLTNKLASLMHLPISHLPFLVAISYAVGYVLPGMVQHRSQKPL